MILQQPGHQSGTLDTNVTALTVDSFNGVGDNIKPYRYMVMNATGTREAKTNIMNNVPNISELQDIKKIVFRFDRDSPELRTAVENSIIKLQSEFPDYSFEAIFGND